MKTIKQIAVIGGTFENQTLKHVPAICEDGYIYHRLTEEEIHFCIQNDISTFDCVSQSKINLLIEKCNIKL